MRFVLIIAGCLLLAGCEPMRFSQAPKNPEPEEHPRKDRNAPIEIFVTKLPTRPYDEIGIVHANNIAGTSHDRTFEDLKTETRRMGGDAVIVRGSSATTATNSTMITEGVVLVWTDVPKPTEAAKNDKPQP